MVEGPFFSGAFGFASWSLQSVWFLCIAHGDVAWSAVVGRSTSGGSRKAALPNVRVNASDSHRIQIRVSFLFEYTESPCRVWKQAHHRSPETGFPAGHVPPTSRCCPPGRWHWENLERSSPDSSCLRKRTLNVSVTYKYRFCRDL